MDPRSPPVYSEDMDRDDRKPTEAEDREFFAQRAEQERAAADEADCVVRSIHEEMAERYESLAAGEEVDRTTPSPLPASEPSPRPGAPDARSA